MMPMNFLTPMKLLFSCNYAVIGDKSWKSIQIISLPVLPRTLCSHFTRLSLLSIGIVWWHKSIANFLSVCVCDIKSHRKMQVHLLQHLYLGLYHWQLKKLCCSL